MAAEIRFRAMGTDVHVVAVGPSRDALPFARSEVERLEAAWSRFVEGSEISRLNACAGKPLRVSAETLSLVSLAVEGWAATGGLFDPTVLHSIAGAGYDRSFELLTANGPLAVTIPAPGCDGILLDETLSEITLPPATGIDPGGIGKGYAADLIAERMLTDGKARGICINIGGDLRVAGESPDGDPWVVAVQDPFDGTELGRIPIESGAVATSTHVRRRWLAAGEPKHHLIDPRTGDSAWTGIAAVTVVTGEAWWAEVLAKAAFVAGIETAGAMLTEFETPALLVADNGKVRALTGMEAWLS